MDGKVSDIKDAYLNKRGRYLYIIMITKNPKTRRDYEKALKRLDNKWKAYCFTHKSEGYHYSKKGWY